MKALSLWQPWASLWASGRKRYETRHWETRYRGALLVHAAQKICVNDIGEELRAICEGEFGSRWATELPRGALIARCILVDCIPTEILTVSPEESLQGNFSDDRFAWDQKDMQLLAAPIPWRGRQSLFAVPDAVINGMYATAPVHELF